MTSTHDQTDPVDHDESPEELRRELAWHREQLSIALDALRACYAVLRYANDNLEHGVGHRPGGSDALRIAEASDQLRGLLDTRGGAWEAEPVRKLDEPLRDVLAVLEHGVDQ